MSYIVVSFISFILGIVLMCLLQVNKINAEDVRKKEIIDYLHTYAMTNNKGKTEYDKGYTDALEYASVLIKEEL